MMYRSLAVLLLLAAVLCAAETPMPPENIRATFDRAFDLNTPNPQRLPMVKQLVEMGPTAAPVVGKDVNDRLLAGRRGGQDTANLLRLAAAFGEKGTACIPALTQLASGGDIYVVPAIDALGRIGPAAQSAVPTIIAAEKSDTRKFYPIATALGRIKGPEAEKALKAALTDKSPLKVAAAKLALVEFDPKAPEANGYRKEAIATLLKETTEGDTYRRGQARLLYAKLDASAAVALVPLLDNAKAKYAAVEAMYAIHTGEANENGGRVSRTRYDDPPLARLKNLSPADRAAMAPAEKPLAAIAASNQSGKDEAMELLGVLFADSDAGIDAMIANLKGCSQITDPPIEALVNVGKKAVPKLQARYKSMTDKDRERGWVLAAWARIDPASVPDPNEFMKEPLNMGESQLGDLLAALGDRGIAYTLDRDRNSNVRIALRLPKGPQSIVPIMQRLAKADEMRSADLSRALQDVVRPEDLPLLLTEFKKLPANRQKEPAGVIAVLLRDNAPVQKKLIADPDAGVRRIAAESYSNRPLDADTVDTLLDVWAKEPDEDVRKSIVRALQGYGGKLAADGLLKRLDTLPEARQAEAVSLLVQQSQRDPSQLEPMLASKSPKVRAAAVTALSGGRRGNGQPWPTPAAEKLATDPSPEVRAALASTLGFRGDPNEGPSPLALSMLKDSDGSVRAAAAAALTSTRIAGQQPKPLPPELAALFSDPDPRVRAVVRRQQVFATSSMTSPFKEMLAGDKWQQCSALEILAKGASEELRPAITGLLKSSDPLVRAYAAGAMAGLPPTVESTTALAQMVLADSDPTVRSVARRTMAVSRTRLPTTQRSVEVVIPTPPPPPTSGPSVPPAPAPLQRTRTVMQTIPVGLKFDANAKDDATVLASAVAGDPSDATIGTMLDWLGGADDRKAEAATVAISMLAQDPKNLKTLSWEWPKRPPLTRALYGALIYRSYIRERFGDVPGGSPAEKNLQDIAAGNDRAAKIAQFAIVPTPQQPAPPTDAFGMLNDGNVHVRILAIRTFERNRGVSLSDEQRKATRDALYKALEDPDVEFVTAASQAGSSNNLFGDGSVRTDTPASVRDACSEFSIRMAGCEPGERQALAKESLKVAADSPYLVPTWINLLHDYDPAVRALAAHGLHRYGDLWMEMRMPKK